MLALTDHELRQTDTADHAIERARRASRSARSSSSAAAARSRPPSPTPRSRSSARWRTPTSIVDPAEVELDPASAAFLESDEADKTTRVNVETLREFSQREPEGKKPADRPALPRLPGRDQGRRQGREDRRRPQRAGRGRRRAARQGHRRARRARVRPGPALGRLHRHPDRGRPLRREARPDPQRGRPRARLPRLRPQGRPLHRRLDQARPLRRDRDQQERRAGDRPAPARRRRVRRRCSTRRAPTPRRSRICSPSAASATSASRTGRRSTRPRSAAASRTAARGSSSSASRRCSAPSAKKSASRSADKKLHFCAPHARPDSRAAEQGVDREPPGPMRASRIRGDVDRRFGEADDRLRARSTAPRQGRDRLEVTDRPASAEIKGRATRDIAFDDGSDLTRCRSKHQFCGVIVRNRR